MTLHRIKQVLGERRLTQYEAARAIGISETRLSRVVRGRIEATPQEKGALARLLGTTVEDLFPADAGPLVAGAQVRRATR